MTKLHKALITIVSVLLVFAVVFGVVTRKSYKHVNPDDVMVNILNNSAAECVKDVEFNSLIKQLESRSCAFVVTVEKNEFVHQAEKTTVTVDKVIKGDTKIVNQKIVIFEPNHISYHYSYSYYFINNVNNIMQPGKQYLVFPDKIKYSEEFEKTLEYQEYIIEWNLPLYSFPVNNKVERVPFTDIVPYRDIKNYDYFCYTEEEVNHLEDIRVKVLEKYL